MFWQEDHADHPFQVPDDIVDVLFAIDCKRLPVDHAHALSAALRDSLPWLGEAAGVGIHTVHVAGSQNGWQRPEHGADQHLAVSRRTKLTIRVPKDRVDALVNGLRGKTLLVAGCPLTVQEGKPRPLGKETTLFARYVVTRPEDTEAEFLAWAAGELSRMGIRIRKALCGKEAPLATPGGPLHTRSLLLAELSPEESVRLQQTGLGTHREMGCGIFIPHKGIGAVQKAG
jgi:CRISPR-associated protein Cas6